MNRNTLSFMSGQERTGRLMLQSFQDWELLDERGNTWLRSYEKVLGFISKV
jgi:hypothetical protein